MKIKHQVVTFDAADLASESAFWAGVLGGHPFCLCFLVGDRSYPAS